MDLAKRLQTLSDDSRLEALLVQWAREYGHGPAENLGYGSQNALYRLERHAGWLPPPEPVRAPVQTESDRIDRLVTRMQAIEGGWRMASVLRMDYFCPKMFIDARLQKLRGVGVFIGKTTYYDALAQAKDYLRKELQKPLQK